MSTLQLGALLEALADVFAPEIDRQFNRQSVLASILPVKRGEGKSIAWDVRFSRAKHAKSFAEGSAVAEDEFQHDITTPATLGWGLYRSAFSISGLALAVAKKSTSSPDELRELFESNLSDAASDLVSQINEALYIGDGTGSNIAGLFGAGAIAPSGVYADIQRSTYPEWASNVLGNAGTPRPLTKALLDQLEETIYTQSGMMPDVIVCSPSIARSYETLFESMSRVFIERGDLSVLQKDAPNVGGPLIPPNTGFTGLSYKGIPIYRDRNCPSGRLVMLNRQFVHIRVLAPADNRTSTMHFNKQLPGALTSNAPIAAHVDSLAKLGDSERFQLVTYLQLQVRKPGACGAIIDLS